MESESEPVGYLVSWFPAITETFILEEVRDLRARGVPVEVFPLFGRRGGDVHAAWAGLEACTHYHASLSWEIVTAQLHWLRRRPAAYLSTWWDALRGNAPSRKLFLRTPIVVAKAALIARRIEALGIRHVHAHWATHPTLAAWVVQALTGVGYSFTTHAHDLYVDTAMLREKVEAARFVVTISDFNRAIIEGHCGAPVAGKIHVVRCGVDLAAFAPRPRTPSETATFVCVAGLREYKGHDVLFDACRLLRDRGFRLRVVLVGEGVLRRHLEERIVREGLSGIVELVGAMPHERIPDLLATATAMVLPSVRARDGQMEGIPVALMEAMAAGVPVISTRISGVPELVEDGVTGLLVEERDAAGLAAAMQRIAAAPELAARFVEAARRTVRERFDRSRNVAMLETLLVGAKSAALPRAPPADGGGRAPAKG
jgi:colanic acid/amylovoran biosynthesis glycosyltransferase